MLFPVIASSAMAQGATQNEMTPQDVMPAKAGIQAFTVATWAPAFAGVTLSEGSSRSQAGVVSLVGAPAKAYVELAERCRYMGSCFGECCQPPARSRPSEGIVDDLTGTQ